LKRSCKVRIKGGTGGVTEYTLNHMSSKFPRSISCHVTELFDTLLSSGCVTFDGTITTTSWVALLSPSIVNVRFSEGRSIPPRASKRSIDSYRMSKSVALMCSTGGFRKSH
jgi:hypothetical protein